MKKEKMNCKKAQNLCLLKVLAKFEHFPKRESEKEAWFLSPLRSETQASFKVSKRKNRWYDHGLGIGGNAIDLIIRMLNCTVQEALYYLNNNLSIPIIQHQLFNKEECSGIIILRVQSIQHPSLKNYIATRKISLETIRNYCKEVWYKNNGKTFFSIGLKNELGGWELRNKYFKTSTSPKAFSYIQSDNTNLTVTEGLFDALTLLTYKNQLLTHSDILILNSTAFIEKALHIIQSYPKVYLYLDNDPTGRQITERLLSSSINCIDNSYMYQSYKDLNEWWINKN